jgi:hypothetical protein
MSAEKFPIPAWVTPEQRPEFVLRLAACYYTMGGSLGDLSEALEGSRPMLHMALKSKGGLSAQTCIKLEELLGRDLFPRECFRPDIFVAE